MVVNVATSNQYSQLSDMATKQEYRKIYTKYQADASGLIATLRSIDANAAKAAREFKKLNDNISVLRRITKAGFYAFWLTTYTEAVARLAYNFALAADNVTLLQSRFKFLSGGSTAGLGNVITFADELGLTLENASQQVQVFAPGLARIGKSFGETTTFVSDLTKTFRLYGVQADAAWRATYQLSQAFSSGRLQGEELRAIQENAGGLAFELEKAVKAITGSTEPLRELGQQGKLTSDVLYQAFGDVFNNLRTDLDELPELVRYSADRVVNAWSLAFGSLSQATRFDQFVKFILDNVADLGFGISAYLGRVDLLPTESLIESLAEIERVIERFKKATRGGMVAFGNSTIAAEASSRLLSKALEDQLAIMDELAERGVDTSMSQGDMTEEYRHQQKINALYDRQKILLTDKKQLIEEIAKAEKLQSEISIIEVSPQSQAALDALAILLERNRERLDEVSVSLEEVNKQLENETPLTDNLRAALAALNAELQVAKDKQAALKGEAGKTSAELRQQQQEAQRLADAWDSFQLTFGEFRDASQQIQIVRQGMALLIPLLDAGKLSATEYARALALVAKAGEEAGREQAIRLQKEANAPALERATEKLKLVQEGISELEQTITTIEGAVTRTTNDFIESGLPVPPNIANQIDQLLSRLDQSKEELKAYRNLERETIDVIKQLGGEAKPAKDSLIVTEAEAATEALDDLVTQAKKAADIADKLSAGGEALIQFRVEYGDLAGMAEQINYIARAQTLLNQALDAGAINGDEYRKFLQGVIDDSTKLGAKLGDLGVTFAQLGEKITLELNQAFASWIDSAIDGTFKLRDALSGLLKDLTKLFLQAAVFQSIKAANLGDFFKDFFANGAAFYSGTNLPHGVYTQPTFFKAYATGGVLGERGAEAVLPLARLPGGDLGVKSGGGGNVTVNVMESQTEGGKVKERTMNDGSKVIDVLVAQIRGEVVRDIRSGGNVAQAIEMSYGVNRAAGSGAY